MADAAVTQGLIVNGYVSLDEVKAHLHNIGDQVDDVLISSKINQASRLIDTACSRRFYQDSSGSARVFVAENPYRVDIHDCTSITAVKTDTGGDGTYDTTWSSGDYQEEPLNGVRDGLEGWPTHVLRAVGTRCFPVSPEARLQVTATWGWAAVPHAVQGATLLAASRLVLRRNSSEGFVGIEGAGIRALQALDRDAAEMISPFVRVAV